MQTHTHTHIQSSTVVIIYAIIGSERDTIRDNTKNQGYMIVYIIICDRLWENRAQRGMRRRRKKID